VKCILTANINSFNTPSWEYNRLLKNTIKHNALSQALAVESLKWRAIAKIEKNP